MTPTKAPAARRPASRRRARRLLAGARSERGQALAEFTLVLPIVLVIFLGIAVFGVALNDWINETQLVSEGARFAAVNQNPGEKEGLSLSQWLAKQGDNQEVKAATTTICSPTSAVGDWVELKMTYKYKWFGLAKLFHESAETPLTSTARERIEAKPSTNYPTTC